MRLRNGTLLKGILDAAAKPSFAIPAVRNGKPAIAKFLRGRETVAKFEGAHESVANGATRIFVVGVTFGNQ